MTNNPFMVKAFVMKAVVALGVVVALFLLDSPKSWIVAAIIVSLGIGWTCWGVFDPNSSIWADTVWRAPASVNAVTLTFDDGPDPEFTPQILEILDRMKVPAAFFCVGCRVAQYPEIARRIVEAGHLIGNHSESHALTFNFRLHRRTRQEIRNANLAIFQATGVTPRLFRAPRGFKHPALGDVLFQEKMPAVGWQIRSYDAVFNDAPRIVRRIVDGTEAGGVILLHDGGGLRGGNDRRGTVTALPEIIDRLRARGFEFVRLDELLKLESSPVPQSFPEDVDSVADSEKQTDRAA